MILDLWIHLLGAVLAVNLVKGLAVVGTAFVLVGLAKRMSPETRHVLWFWVICLFLLLPLAWLAVPTIQVGALIPEESAALYRVAVSPMLARSEYIELVEKAGRIEALSEPGRETQVSRIWSPLVLAWFGGVLVLAGRLVVGRWRLKRLRGAASSSQGVQRTLSEAASGMSLGKEVLVLLSPRCSVPFTFGCWRPVVLLPTAAPGWPHRQLRSVLTHELGHIKRRDVLTQSIAYAVCVLFWFILPIWLAYAAMVREAETCCDRYVINQGIRRTQYAKYIVGLATSSEGRLLLPCISSTIGRKTMLMERVKKVLSLEPALVSAGVRSTIRVLVVCLVCLLPLVAVTCATKPAVIQADDPLYGVWVNPDYGKLGADTYARWEIYPEGRELRYVGESDAKPNCEIRNVVIEEMWTDSENNRWYKGHYSQALYPYTEEMFHIYWLRKLSASRTTLEFVGSGTGYPREMSRIGGDYFIHYKGQ